MDVVELQLFDLVVRKQPRRMRHSGKFAVAAADQERRLNGRIAHTLRRGDRHTVERLRDQRKFDIRNLNRQQLIIPLQGKRHIPYCRNGFVEHIHQQAPDLDLFGAQSLFPAALERIIERSERVGRVERFEQLPEL